MGTGTVFLRTRLSHGKPERRFVASLRMPDGSRPTVACPHQHASRDRQPCAEANANLEELRRIRTAEAPLDLLTLTVGAYLTRWSAMLTDLAYSTIRGHREIIANHLEPAFRSTLLTALRPSEIDVYLGAKQLDPQTLRHHRATLRRALSDAVRDGYVDRNVAALSRPPRMTRRERRYLTGAEARRLIDASRGERLWPVWTLLVATGLRLSEALGLAWSDIDFTAATLTVRRQIIRADGKWRPIEPKTERSRRTILLIPAAIEALREQQRRQAADLGDRPRPVDLLVFTTAAGFPIHGTNILPPFRRALAAAGLPKVRLHDLRHAYAAIMLGAGVPLIVVSRTLGHSSIRITADIYSEVVPELYSDAAAKLAEALR